MYLDPSGMIAIVDDLAGGGLLLVAFGALLILSIVGVAWATGALDGLSGALNDIGNNIDNTISRTKTAISSAVTSIAFATATLYSEKFLSGYYVYQLYDINGEIFYVGITRNRTSRENAHYAKYGRDISIQYIACDLSLSEARVIETGLIAFYTYNRLKNQRLSISNIRYCTELLLNQAESDLLLLIGS
jgi:hypothetical protein